MKFILRILLPVLLWISVADAETVPVASTYEPGRDYPKLKTESAFLFIPGQEWTYSHHPQLTFFKGAFYAMWSNGYRDEDAVGQRVLLATAEDIRRWTEPRILAEPGRDRVLTAAGFHQHAGTLVAYFSEYDAVIANPRLLATTTQDGVHWSPIQALGLPVTPNDNPRPTASGRLIMAGHIAFPYTDDPMGMKGWKMTGIYPPDMAETSDDPASFWRVRQRMNWSAALCEGSFYQTDDGLIHMLLRSTGPGYRGRLWLTESRDDGATWSPPQETLFPDNDAKFQFGRLPDGRFYYVGCPDSSRHGARSPLVLSLSRDGVTFDRHFIMGDEPYRMTAPGWAKGGEYGYPDVLAQEGRLCVIVSRQKEAVQIICAALAQLGDGTEQAQTPCRKPAPPSSP